MSSGQSFPRASKVELYKRIRNTYELIMKDFERPDIINSVMQKYGISIRQAERYYDQAFKMFMAKDEKSLSFRKQYHINRRLKLINEMDPKEKVTAAGVKAISHVLDRIAKIEGVDISDTVKVIGSKEQPIHTEAKVTYSTESIDYSKVPTELLEHLIAHRKKS